MSMLSLSCQIGVKAVIYLGSKFDSGEKAGIKEVAKFINENEHTVGKILQKLSKDQIINSIKGPTGGYFLDEGQTKQPIINIIHAIDGKEVFKQCGLGLSKCSETHPCPFHNDFKPIRDLFYKMCSEKSVLDLYQNVNDGLAHLIG